MGRSCKLRQSVRGAKRPLSRGSRRKTSVFCPPLFPLHRRLRRGDRGGRGITPTIVTEVRSTPVREDSVQVGYVRVYPLLKIIIHGLGSTRDHPGEGGAGGSITPFEPFVVIVPTLPRFPISRDFIAIHTRSKQTKRSVPFLRGGDHACPPPTRKEGWGRETYIVLTIRPDYYTCILRTSDIPYKDSDTCI